MVSAWSVPQAKRQERIEPIPGPGEYNPQNSPKIVGKADPRYSFGKDSRKADVNVVPGPGSYDSKIEIAKEHTPKYTMSPRRELKSDILNLGPGSYNPSLKAVRETGPAYSLKGRSSSTIQVNPGPGQYELKGQIDSKKQKYGNQFGKESREFKSSSQAPGPGSYDYEAGMFKQGSKNYPSYGFGAKIEAKNYNEAPGPGQYDSKSPLYSKIGGIISRDMRMSMTGDNNPGPGNYQMKDILSREKSPSWTVSQSKRDSAPNLNSLGPGQYDHAPVYSKIALTTPAYHFGSESRLREFRSEVPGPGSYATDHMKRRGSIIIGAKPKDMSKSDVPGPGTYDSLTHDRELWLKGGSRYSLPKGSRDDMERSQVPGPGSYENKLGTIDNPRGKVTFGKDIRLKQTKSDVPGPGNYELKPYFADVPKYLLPGK